MHEDMHERMAVVWIRGIVLVILFVCVGGSVLFVQWNWGCPRHPDLAFISRLSHVRFPRSAKVAHSNFEKAFQGGTLWAEVEIDSSDVDTFLESLPAGVKRSRNERILDLANASFENLGRPDWWNPDSARKFVAVLLAYHPQCGAVVSLDDPSRAVVYLVWWA